jgi:adenylate kinase family enzyme
VRRVAIIASASGNGKTTLGRALAKRIGVRFIELDALVHGPSWTETPDDELRARLEPILAEEGWVVDGSYTSKIGTLVLDAADTIVWLDLPTRVWLWRLLGRTHRRVSGREQLWNDNKETWLTALWGRESLFDYALMQQPKRRRGPPPVSWSQVVVVVVAVRNRRLCTIFARARACGCAREAVGSPAAWSVSYSSGERIPSVECSRVGL